MLVGAILFELSPVVEHCAVVRVPILLHHKRITQWPTSAAARY
ncbi:hypothetical protein I545_6703 [Mycobacterium kansasii 662]|uniref:Uncharacterized protein n=1 Tax=Mycobacterium kansasii 662 TaxID=1299326 RepID=X7XZ74_MYCKA|nr:hypothetical protein I545_6703 [Mycobacterium kansasii 662]